MSDMIQKINDYLAAKGNPNLEDEVAQKGDYCLVIHEDDGEILYLNKEPTHEYARKFENPKSPETDAEMLMIFDLSGKPNTVAYCREIGYNLPDRYIVVDARYSDEGDLTMISGMITLNKPEGEEHFYCMGHLHKGKLSKLGYACNPGNKDIDPVAKSIPLDVSIEVIDDSVEVKFSEHDTYDIVYQTKVPLKDLPVAKKLDELLKEFE